MQIITKKINEIKPYEKNPRKNDEAAKYVANSIKEFGFKVPIVIDKDGVIIAGHTRYKAAKKLKMKEVPCIMADDLTEEQVKAFRLADNKVGEMAEWDDDLLAGELDGIADIDMSDFGFGDEDRKPESDGKAHDDEYDMDFSDPEPRTKLGDVYVLGDHRLVCGDATKTEYYEKLMGKERADLVLTDPPYNVAIGDKTQTLAKMTGHGHAHKNIKGDAGMTDDECREKLWEPSFRLAREYSKDKCSIYMSMPQGGTHMMMMMGAADAGWNVKHELMWVKNAATFSLGRLDYDYQHEPILYGWNKSHAFYANDYKVSVMEQERPDIDKLDEKEAKRLLKKIFKESDKAKTTVLRYNKPTKCDLHPTMKPLELWGELIENSTKKGMNVLDIYGGSGTTLIACEQMGRKCFIMELDPHYCDVIIDRWEKLTGKKAEKNKLEPE